MFLDNYYDPYEKNYDGGSPSPAELDYASILERLVARVIDVTIIYIITFAFGIVSFISLSLIASAATSTSGSSSAASDIFMCCCCLIFIAIFAIEWLYYTWFESSHFMGSPGKILMKIAVTDESGEPISFRKAALRNVVKLVANQFMGIGSLFALFSSKKQGLYDMIAGTYVVKK